MNLHPHAFLDELQVAVVLAEEKLNKGWIFKMNPGDRGLPNFGFQAGSFSAGCPKKIKETLLRMEPYMKTRWILASQRKEPSSF